MNRRKMTKRKKVTKRRKLRKLRKQRKLKKMTMMKILALTLILILVEAIVMMHNQKRKMKTTDMSRNHLIPMMVKVVQMKVTLILKTEKSQAADQKKKDRMFNLRITSTPERMEEHNLMT